MEVNMGALEQLETKFSELFVKNAPFQIPENGRKWIAQYAWIFSLIGAILGVLWFFPLLAAVGLVSAFGVAAGAGFYVLLAWLSLFILIGYAVILAIATPKLKRFEKSGWNLVYYSILFFFVYDVVNWLRYPVSGLFGFVLNLVGTAAGLYVLFQVRDYFTGKKSVSTATKSKK